MNEQSDVKQEISQSQVDAWLEALSIKLKEAFGERLKFIGHIGSWARGEPHSKSDIDCLVTLDVCTNKDISALRDIFRGLSSDEFKPGGILVSVKELKQTPPFHMAQLFFNGCKTVYGSVEGLIPSPSTEDLVIDIKMKACDNLHIARHLLMFGESLSGMVSGLRSNFYSCFFALQNWILVTHGRYVERKEDILDCLDDPIDKQVVSVARDWYDIEDDPTTRASYYVELLEQWSRGMLAKLETYEKS